MPSDRAAWVRLPRLRSSVRAITARSTSSSVSPSGKSMLVDSRRLSREIIEGRSSSVRRSESASTNMLSTQLRNCRMLPGQW